MSAGLKLTWSYTPLINDITNEKKNNNNISEGNIKMKNIPNYKSKNSQPYKNQLHNTHTHNTGAIYSRYKKSGSNKEIMKINQIYCKDIINIWPNNKLWNK